MNEDIVSGIKNAVEHGATLEEAIESFLNAGYSSNEVQEAAHYLTTGATSAVNPSAQVATPRPVVREVKSSAPVQSSPAPQSPASPSKEMPSQLTQQRKVGAPLNPQVPKQVAQQALVPRSQPRPVSARAPPQQTQTSESFQAKPLPQVQIPMFSAPSTSTSLNTPSSVKSKSPGVLILLIIIAIVLILLIAVGVVFSDQLIALLSDLMS